MMLRTRSSCSSWIIRSSEGPKADWIRPLRPDPLKVHSRPVGDMSGYICTRGRAVLLCLLTALFVRQ